MEFTSPPNQNTHEWNARPSRYPIYLPEADSFAEDHVARQRTNGGSGRFLPLRPYGDTLPTPPDGGEPPDPTAA